jgi:aspartyl-tRNA(Asn)/glutamyl-tRNA(Gln) amidotransferase subunit A
MDPNRPLWQWSACDLHRAYRNGQTTPLAALHACMARIAEVNPKINAFVARREAVWQDAGESTARYRLGQPLSALDGLPISIKDNLCTADMPTTWGSPALRGHQSGIDEWPVARARAAGALIVGKTNVPEFTLEGYTDNALFGPTRNPWNLALTPGGSSGGAVASVAAGCTPLAMGTDGGGSIRRPASHCGIVGFKPSIGSIARGNGLPSLLLDFEVVGSMARSVADARLLFEVLRGPVDGDRASLAAAAANPVSRPLTKPLRVLYVPTLNQAPVDLEIDANCSAAARQIALLGNTVHTGELPLQLDDINSAWSSVGQIGLAALFARHPGWRQRASVKYSDMAELGHAVSAPALWALLSSIERLREACTNLFQEWDVIAMPSAAALPWPAAQAFPTEIAGQTVGPRGHAVFTGWVNAAGLPAISIPVAPSINGLPIGLQLIGAYGTDDALFDLAQVIEGQIPWAHRWPKI